VNAHVGYQGEIEVTEERGGNWSVILECVGDLDGDYRGQPDPDDLAIRACAAYHACSSYKIIGPGYQGTLKVKFYGNKISIRSLIRMFEDDQEIDW
jgi:hypothetical protein